LDWTYPKSHWCRWGLCLLINLLMIIISFQVSSFMVSLITYWTLYKLIFVKNIDRIVQMTGAFRFTQ
jgi:hypothetical protein